MTGPSEKRPLDRDGAAAEGRSTDRDSSPPGAAADRAAEKRPSDRDSSSPGAAGDRGIGDRGIGDRGIGEAPRRRRRVRSDTSRQAPVPSPAALAAMTSPIHDEDTPGADPSSGEDREVERGLRGLVGGGSSQVSVLAAMRARDATRPTAEDLASAETNLMIIRRGWTPPDPKR